MAKKKKDNKNVTYIIGAIVVVVVLVFLFMRMNQTEEPTETAPEEPEEVEETEPEPEPVEPTEYKGEEIVANAVCSNGSISGVITNVADSTVNIGNELKVMVRGLVVSDPGCDEESLESGQSTTCTALNGNFPVVEGKNQVTVRIAGAKEGQATVVCE